VPVVSSNIVGVSDIVNEGETGYMVDPGDNTALASAIDKIWTNQDIYNIMRINARKLITDKFNKATQFERFVSHFQALKPTD